MKKSLIYVLACLGTNVFAMHHGARSPRVIVDKDGYHIMHASTRRGVPNLVMDISGQPIAASKAGNYVCVIRDEPLRICVYETQSATLVANVFGLAADFSPDGDFMLTGDCESIQLYKMNPIHIIWAGPGRYAKFGPMGHLLIHGNEVMTLYDTTRLCKIGETVPGYWANFNTNGELLFVVNRDPHGHSIITRYHTKTMARIGEPAPFEIDKLMNEMHK